MAWAKQDQSIDQLEFGLRYLLDTTIKTDTNQLEWGSTIIAVKNIPFLGVKGKSAYDSNNFTTSHVHNILLEILQNRTDLIPLAKPVMGQTLKRILEFQNPVNKSFNFWKKVKLQEHQDKRFMQRMPKRLLDREQTLPSNFILNNKFAVKRADIFEDADDTSLSFLSLFYHDRIFKTDHLKEAPIGPLFSRWLDTAEDRGRKTTPFYSIYGYRGHTGAFLTWHGQEQIRFLASPLFMQWEQSGIAEGTNNVDCVVNANVLNTLALMGELETPGVDGACRMLNDIVREGWTSKCGIYYPNPYQLHYAMANAYHSGAQCLAPSVLNLKKQLVMTQKQDGGWNGYRTTDRLTSTLYAANALIDLAESEADLKRVERALERLQDDVKIDKDNTHLQVSPMTFFSGGVFVKNSLLWKSQHYSTAMYLRLYHRYSQKMNSVKKASACGLRDQRFWDNVLDCRKQPDHQFEDFELVYRDQDYNESWKNMKSGQMFGLSMGSQKNCEDVFNHSDSLYQYTAIKPDDRLKIEGLKAVIPQNKVLFGKRSAKYLKHALRKGQICLATGLRNI
jgi:hypothetical protein